MQPTPHAPLLAALVASLSVVAAPPGAWAAAGAHARVCADPSQPGPGFKPHDLSFPLPGGKPRPEARSAAYYAVILRTAKRCAVTEAERQEVQALFPRNKMFATRFECDDDSENNVTYTNVSPKHGFLAVYAGETAAAGKTFLASVRATGRFGGANLRKMQVVFVYP